MLLRAQHCAAVDATEPHMVSARVGPIGGIGGGGSGGGVGGGSGGRGGGGDGGSHARADGNTNAASAAVCCVPARPGASRAPCVLTHAHFEVALEGFTPASLRGVRDSHSHLLTVATQEM